MDSAEHLTAVAADNHLSEAVVDAKTALLAVFTEMDTATSYQFFLNLHKNFTRDNGFVAIFHIVLRDKAVVLDPLFREEVNGVSFLQKGIADVLLISENLVSFLSLNEHNLHHYHHMR